MHSHNNWTTFSATATTASTTAIIANASAIAAARTQSSAGILVTYALLRQRQRDIYFPICNAHLLVHLHLYCHVQVQLDFPNNVS
ncbi:hypothetical protein BDF22DRAFT_739265 [Syncephalis plumigaleata]|nr:hypothetical protein BDF22DRAFT_739265 [Syncephalis plumigaleata]